MRGKRAKQLRREARAICALENKPEKVDFMYKKLKKLYKRVKGQR